MQTLHALTLTPEYVRSILIYEPDTGQLYYRPRRVRPGHEKADRLWNGRYARPKVNPKRYANIRIDGVLFKAHRVAWFHYYGYWPPEYIDHINGDKSDNRITNLRAATPRQNRINGVKRQAGLKGTRYRAQQDKWDARITIGGVPTFLGRFATERDAHEAYRAAAARYHGEFASIE